MKILLTGGHGQIGWELARSLLPLGEVIVLQREQLDLSDLDRLRVGIAAVNPDVIVNAAAYTSVDKAEQEAELVFLINEQAPAVMAEEMSKRNGLLLHYSTDYVFDGTLNRPYRESDIATPVNLYGKSKAAGEAAIQSTGADHLILRTSWVYAARAKNFVKTILKLAAEREELKIVDDQWGTPSWARLIAETSAHIIRQSMQEKGKGAFVSDIYHLTSADTTSWYGFAKAIIDIATKRGDIEIKTSRIKPIPSVEFPLPAKRPQNSVLNISKLELKFALKMPTWQQALQLCMQEIQSDHIK